MLSSISAAITAMKQAGDILQQLQQAATQMETQQRNHLLLLALLNNS